MLFVYLLYVKLSLSVFLNPKIHTKCADKIEVKNGLLLLPIFKPKLYRFCQASSSSVQFSFSLFCFTTETNDEALSLCVFIYVSFI